MKRTNSRWIVVWMIIVLNSVPFATRSASGPDTPLQSAEGEFRDADTGITYRRTSRLIGSNDVVQSTLELRVAPSGKFVVESMRVIPLDGQPSFKLVDFPAGRSALSPDGKKVAFFAGDIWMIPISPETGKPLGAPEKLVQGKDWWYQFCVLWSPDSARFVYWQENNLYAYSIPDHRTTQLTQGPVIKVPLDWSADGKSIIYGEDDAIWQVALDELQPRKIVKDAASRAGRFTADGKWLFFLSGNKLRFVRVADAVQAELKLPGTIGQFIGTSPDRKKLLFYRSSSEDKETWRFISSLGGSPFFPGAADRLSGWDACWTPDSRFVVMSSQREDAPGHWVVPLSGDKPFPLQLAVSVEGKLAQESLSPGGQSLLFSAENAQGRKCYWVAPVSVRAGKTVGAPVKVCEQAGAQGLSWSPDGKKLAWQQKDGIWIAGADGSGARQLYTNSEPEGALQWAPNSRGLSWQSYPTQKSPDGTLLFIGLSGETPKKLTDRISPLQPNVGRALWSPDSQRMAYWRYGSDHEPDGLSVIDVQTQETRKLFEQPFRRYAGRTMAWAPDGSELAVVAADGKLLAFQVPDGKRRIVADLQTLHRNRCVELKWSPTGTHLALILWAAPGEEAADNASARFLTVSSRDGVMTPLAVDEKGDVNVLHWSPNGEWILYDSETTIKTRAWSEIWEADLDALLRQAQAKR